MILIGQLLPLFATSANSAPGSDEPSLS